MNFSKVANICQRALTSLRTQFSDSEIVLEAQSAQQTEDFFAEPEERVSAVEDSDAWIKHLSDGQNNGPG